MPDSQDFNSQKDINRYLQQQGRAPQSHMDWEMWRKTGQPGTYQAPPGSPSTFRGVRGGGGGPNYDTGVNHYNMFTGLNDTIEKTVGGVGGWAANKLKGSRDGKMDKDNSGSTASSRNGSDMADDGSMGPPVAGGGRSQNASITSPASSRGMRRGRRGDFSGALASHGITMVQGNDNYGTVYGNMGGANVGNGDYDNSFQSKNSGGRQTAFSGNNSTFGGGSPTPPVGPTTPTPPPPPPTPPVSPTPPPTPPVGPGTPPQPPYRTPPPPPITTPPPPIKMQPPGTPPQIGAPPVGPQTPVAGPQRPGTPAIGAGPQPAGAIESGPQPAGQLDESKRTKVPGGLYAHANDEKGGPEAATARQKLNEKGVNGPWLSETAGPQAPAAGPMSQPVEGPVNPASKINEQGGVGAKKYGPAKPKPKIGDPDYKPAMGKNPLNDKSSMKPLTTLIPQTVEGPKSVASKAPAKKTAAKTKEKK
jgi:hypothetical protein